MHIVLDCAVVVIIIWCAIAAYRAGFVTTVTRLAGLIVASIAASKVAEILSPLIFDNFVASPIRDQLHTALTSPGGDGAANATLSQVLAALPEPILNLMGIEQGAQNLESSFAAALSESVEQGSNFIMENLIRPAVLNLIELLLFLILFSVFMVVVRLVIRAIMGVRRIPVIGGVDGILGAVLGVAKGVIIVMILAFVLVMLAMLTNNQLGWLSQDVIDRTALFRYFYIPGWFESII